MSTMDLAGVGVEMLARGGMSPTSHPHVVRLAAALLRPDCVRLVGTMPDGGDTDGHTLPTSRRLHALSAAVSGVSIDYP